MKVTFTVVIPTYDRPRLLERAIRSVRAQSYPHWELIVVEDDERERCRPFVTELAGADERIRYRSQPNAGPGAARSLGAKVGKGDFFCFLDDDDYWQARHLEALSTAINRTEKKNSLFRTGMSIQTSSGQIRDWPNFGEESDFLRAYWSDPVSLLSFTIPAGAVRVCPPVTIRSPIEDFEWLCQLLARFDLEELPDYTVVYVEHTTNRTNTLMEERWLTSRLAVIDRLYRQPEIERRITKVAFRRKRSQQALHICRGALRSGQTKLAVKALKAGLIGGGESNPLGVLYTLWVALRGR